uniref:Uncharacterized protein n=1 Tax=Arundo donax TaxID=35708 RepID=A0A0A9D584_ARUDO
MDGFQGLSSHAMCIITIQLDCHFSSANWPSFTDKMRVKTTATTTYNGDGKPSWTHHGPKYAGNNGLLAISCAKHARLVVEVTTG